MRGKQGRKSAAVYIRVSTSDQNPDVQLAELRDYVRRRGWVIHRVYQDKGISGARASRPALDELIADCRRRVVDVVLVWKFDRFARSLRQLTSALEEFRALGIDFVSCTEAIDTSVPHGELVFQILAALAQWERALVGERVRASLEYARSQGKKLGRKPLRNLSPEEITALRAARSRKKLPYRALANQFGVSVWTAHRLCQAGR